MTDRPEVTDEMVRAFVDGATSTPQARPLPAVVVPPQATKIPGAPSAKARTNGRSCGNCTACCTVLGIDAIAKPPATRCPNLKAKGCGIYASRPSECAIYRCLWHVGAFGEDRDRPDRLGLIIDAPEPMAETYLYRDIPFVVVREVRPRASWEPRAARVLTPLAEKMVVVIQAFSSEVQRMIGPRSLVEEVKRRAMEKATHDIAAARAAQEVADGR